MDKVMELHQIIHDLFAAQIEFGTYRYKAPLPKMEEVSHWFSVSLDTVKAVYRRLKTDGYITLTKKAGAAVAIQFQEEDLERNIQTFFALRRDAVLDLLDSFGPLFSRAQWYSLRNVAPEQLDELESLCTKTKVLRPYIMIQHIRLIYGALNNDLLLRLIWQAFLFYQAPFLSLPVNLALFEDSDNPLLQMIALCRQKNWDRLWDTVLSCQDRITSAIRRFYENRITLKPSGEPVPFHWKVYQNSSQRCYSIAIDLLKGVRLGVFTQDNLLPSPDKIAEYMQVSTITIRRTLALLNQMGITQSINGVGTRLMNMEKSLEKCDFTQPVVQKRMLDFIQSLQILAITCGPCAKTVIAERHAVGLWGERLAYTKENNRYESVVYASLEIISLYSPNQTIRQVYKHLVCFLLWGYPLRTMHGSRKEINEYYLPFINSLLDKLKNCDWNGLAAELEKLLFNELLFAAAYMDKLGIKESASLAVTRDGE